MDNLQEEKNMSRGRRSLVFAPFVVASLTLIPVVMISQANAQSTGYAEHRPIVGGATRINPWGALADIVKQAVAPYGWDVQVCYNCAGGENEVIDVEDKKNGVSLTYNPTSLESDGVPASLVDYIEPPPPNGPIDFGIASPQFVWWGYEGTESKSGGTDLPPFKDLRLVATIVSPLYLIVAATAESGITDLSQIAGKPVTVLWDGNLTSAASTEVLAYYGLSQASIQAAGGKVLSGSNPANRTNFDVIIYTGELSEAPEFNIWYQVSQQFDLNYLQLPNALLQQLQKDYDMVPLTVPIAYLKGIWQPIATVGFCCNSVYGRSDMPDQFAYDLAKAIDENKDLLETGYEHYAYDPAQVWKAYGVPLAPGAARYYIQKGYMPPQAFSSGP
jgi:TRAP transporter TAXI family solute receptor